MGFQELPFLFMFLPGFLAVYYIFHGRWRNIVLTLGSLSFYGIGTWQVPWLAALLVCITLISWLVCRWVYGKTWLLFISQIALFGGLFWFKYCGLFGKSMVMPLGMSFYCFQISAMITDTWKGAVPGKQKFSTYTASVLMFPKLLSGPLAETDSLFAQMDCRTSGWEDLDEGLRRFILGLAMKVLLADRIGALWTQVKNIGIDCISMPMAWEGLAAFGLQLYFDFSGYSAMAIGLARMLGFHLPENFRFPYASASLQEFWRRWHITLGAWFKRYVYIPLGGSRKGAARLVFSTMTVWLLTGIWHGNSALFLIWGLGFGTLLLAERYWLGRILKKQLWLGHLYTLIVVFLSWLLFALPDLPSVGIYLMRLVDLASAFSAADFIRYGQSYLGILFLGAIFASPYPANWWKRISHKPFGTVILFILFWSCIYCIAISSNDPFLYFSF